VGAIKKVDISYGFNGQSRGIANVTFARPDGASKAFQVLNGLLVDNKPIKIEIVVSSAQAAAIPAPKSFSERVTQPRPHPKSAAADKHGNTATKATTAVRGRGNGRRGRGGRSSRPTKKTAEELDSEMADYFESANANADSTNGNVAQGNANGDAAMDDGIM